MKKIISLIGLCSLINITAFSQSDVVGFLSSGKDDATQLFEAYLNPYAVALGEGLNNSWYNTAQVHKFLGFDLQLSVSAVKIPSADQTFDISALNLNNIVLASGSNPVLPTIAGKEQAGPELEVYDGENYQMSFNAPPGSGMDIVPVPMLQAGIGIGLHTELIGRYVPEQDILSGDNSKVGLYGIGIKHSFKDWIPFLKHLPFDASLFAGYSTIYAEDNVSFGLDNYGLSPESYDYEQDPNQMLDVESETMKVGLIVSKKVSVLTIFASVSQNSSKLDVDLKGRYPFVTFDGDDVSIADEVDPVSVHFESSHVALDAGLRLKLGFLSFSGSISKSNYTAYNIGVGVGFR